MKKQLKIQTLSPVHIGSGEELMPGTEYVTFRESKEVAVIAPEKILPIISDGSGAADRYDKGMSQWLSVIDKKENLLTNLLKVRKPDINALDISSRVIIAHRQAPQNEKIKTQLHLGSHHAPTVPGTSIKGSIRTVLLNYLIKHDAEFAGQERNLEQRKGQWKDEALQAHYLAPKNGNNFRLDPRKDLLRLLFVGDAAFKSQTELHKTLVINQYREGWDEKKSLSTFYECIPANVSSTFRISVPDDLLRVIQEKGKLDIPADFPAYDINSLFKIINDHTLFLLKDEIEFWQEEDNPMALDNYLDHLLEIEKIAKACADSATCVLRVGAGSGWDYMTGAWPRSKDKNDNYILKDRTWDKLKNSLRKGHYPNEVPFPKTRKLLRGGLPFGFVRLSVLD